MHGLIKNIKQLWCTTNFGSQELSQYAINILLEETRKGVMTMSLLLLGLIIFAFPVYVKLDLHPVYLYTYLLIAILSIHIFFSARKMEDIKTLYLLGITLLTISATAFVSIAHQTSAFSVLLIANVVLLFMTIPLVPWGLREASIVIFIIYSLFTLSTSGMTQRFGSDTLIVLQFLMLAAAMTSFILVARSVRIRKDDISTRFDLEKTRAHLYELSNIDPLTGAWNRRYLSTAITELVNDFKNKANSFHYVLFDIDDFKTLNDTYGHDFGDKVLICIGETFTNNLKGIGSFIRMGGDEFALLLVHDRPDDFINYLFTEIEWKCSKINDSNSKVSMSYGLVTAPLSSKTALDALYLRADKTMYEHKQKENTADDEKLPENVTVLNEESKSCSFSNS